MPQSPHCGTLSRNLHQNHNYLVKDLPMGDKDFLGYAFMGTLRERKASTQPTNTLNRAVLRSVLKGYVPQPNLRVFVFSSKTFAVLE
ncbi:MAG: hypothetical protein KME64_07000 [Scytonematopsis contorta HA4267-MV1]|nr:hypothetical protein [Scytonematopsis contorta HA4267-MV1]